MTILSFEMTKQSLCNGAVSPDTLPPATVGTVVNPTDPSQVWTQMGKPGADAIQPRGPFNGKTNLLTKLTMLFI